MEIKKSTEAYQKQVRPLAAYCRRLEEHFLGKYHWVLTLVLYCPQASAVRHCQKAVSRRAGNQEAVSSYEAVT